MTRHDCPDKAMTYDPVTLSATCSTCGLRWRPTRDSKGKAICYLTPPTTVADRRDRFAGWRA